MQEISCPPAEIKDLKPDEYEVIDTKVIERLCQRSGSYYIKRYVRPVVELKEDCKIVTEPVPAAVFERSYADVTLLSGILVDKFQYFLPLHRQHQRMAQSGVVIARSSLTNWVHRTAALLDPIYDRVIKTKCCFCTPHKRQDCRGAVYQNFLRHLNYRRVLGV